MGSQVRDAPSVGGGSPSLSSLCPVRIQIQGLWREGDITWTSCPPDALFRPQYPDPSSSSRALQPVMAALQRLLRAGPVQGMCPVQGKVSP